MANQQQPTDEFSFLNWGVDCGDLVLTQEEVDSMTQDSNEFLPMEEYNFQPMSTTDYSFLENSYPAPVQEIIQPVPNFIVEDFTSLLEGSCFSIDQFTVPMADDLEQILAEPVNYDQQNTVIPNSIDPAFFSTPSNQLYTSSFDFGPRTPTETFADQDLSYSQPLQGNIYNQQATNYTQQQFNEFQLFDGLELFEDSALLVTPAPVAAPVFTGQPMEDYHFDDFELFGEVAVTPASPKSQLILPAYPTQHVAHKSNAAPIREYVANSATPTWRTSRQPNNVSPLTCAGNLEVVLKQNNPSGLTRNERYQYTVYKPLGPWGSFQYTTRGYLHQSIQFNSTNIVEFLENHPLGDSLLLRIEKHPYEHRSRETCRPQYSRCRAKSCALSAENRFFTGDIRVAIDEVAGRFTPDQVQNNCPYFAAGWIHLECLENLINVAPLVHAGILVPDTRAILPHEPAKISRQGTNSNNKMALVKKQLTQYTKWKATHPANSERTFNEHTLNAVMWIAAQRPGRVNSRAPLGVTSKVVAKFLKENRNLNGWGGRRMAHGTVEKMNEAIAAGRAHEIVAPRNGPSGKKGMNIGSSSRPRNKRSRKELESEASSSSDSEPESLVQKGKRSYNRRDKKVDARKVAHANSDGKNKSADITIHEDRANPAKKVKRTNEQPQGRYYGGIGSSPDNGVTYFASAFQLPKKQDEDNALREITEAEALTSRQSRRQSRRIKEEVETYTVSDDDDTDKENNDPSWEI